jgi:hypothetical protein
MSLAEVGPPLEDPEELFPLSPSELLSSFPPELAAVVFGAAWVVVVGLEGGALVVVGLGLGDVVGGGGGWDETLVVVGVAAVVGVVVGRTSVVE